jgi:2-polyprenyl-6-methoxyphenol hydroxylase-like FAD-dependent oxidoreductase
MGEKLNVLIVGAGPTGLAMANELARAGIRHRVIDRAAHRAMESRAIAIHARTLETFQLMQVIDHFLAAGRRIPMVRIFGDHGPIAQVGLNSLETQYPYVLGVPQDETERILEEQASRRGVRVERNTEVIAVTEQGSTVSARLRNGDRVEDVEAEWLIGCDGAHSTVRDKLAIPFSGSTYPEHFVLADLKVDGGLDPAAGQVWLHEDGALAFFPLPGDRYRLVVANSPADWREQPSLAQCQELVDKRVPGSLKLSDLRWSAVFRIHRREAARFRQGRIFLLGDAAHIHSPVGGQGMNMGIQDAFNLAWKLGLVIKDAASPQLLDSYEQERRPVDEAVIQQTDRATRLVSLHGTVTRFLRDHLMSLVTRLPSVEEKLGEGLSGIAVNYRRSPIVEEHNRGAPGPAAGDRAPDAPVEKADSGTPLRLYDLIAEHRHVLLLIGSDPGDSSPGSLGCPLTVFRVAPRGIPTGDLIDSEGFVAARFGPAPAAYLIRPDGYVGFRCSQNELAAALPAYLARLFGSAPAAVGVSPQHGL